MSNDIRQANRSWEALLTAYAALMRSFGDGPEWEAHGITMREYDVLYTLAKRGTPARLSELQAGVLLSQPALSRLVDRLEERGLLVRAIDPADRRALNIQLSEAGTAVQRSVGVAHARNVARALASLSADEQRQLESLATKLANGIG